MERGDRLREKYTDEGLLVLEVHKGSITVRMDDTGYIYRIYERIYKHYEKEKVV